MDLREIPATGHIRQRTHGIIFHGISIVKTGMPGKSNRTGKA
jgi:hypothetical protein